MIYLLVILFLAQYSADSDFDYSILVQPPWPVTEPCQPFPSTCNISSGNDDNYCSIYDNSTDNWTLQIAIILPDNPEFIVNLERSKEILKEAENKSREQGILPESINISYNAFNDDCNQGKALGEIVAAMKSKCSHLIVGPSCDYCVATVGRTAKYINTPVMTPTGLSYDFTENKTSYGDEFYFMINPGKADFRTFSEFIHLIGHRYKWTKVFLLYEKNDQEEVAGEKTCYLAMSNLMTELKSMNLDFVDGDITTLGINYSELLANKVGINYGIIIACANHQNIRKMVIEAARLKMMDRGEYTFFTIELFNDAPIPSKPWYLNDSDENNDLARIGYQAVYSFLPLPETNFAHVAKKERGSIWLDGIYDGMLMYIQALNNYTGNFNLSITKIFPCEMVYKMMGKVFIDKDNETFNINCNGVRTREVAMVHINSQGEYEVMAKYTTENKTIYYWNVTWTLGEPFDTPKCGFDMSKCPTYDVVKILVVTLIVVIILGMLVVALILYRQIKIRREIEKEVWKVKHDEILFTPSKPRASIYSSGSGRMDFDGFSLAGDRQAYATLGNYNGNTVAVKYFQKIKIELNHDNLCELKAMKDLLHDNLVKFYGACLDIPNCILTEYCSRGSLQDTLENEDVKLDWMFRISLIMDLVRGMHYLHRSPIKCHGALKSPNCLVDSRFKLKITDFGLHFLRAYTNEDNFNKDAHSYWQRQLWTAPELLNMNSVTFKGTQKGDVYSFGIILHEIIMRKGVFYLGENHDMDTKGNVYEEENNYFPGYMPRRTLNYI